MGSDSSWAATVWLRHLRKSMGIAAFVAISLALIAPHAWAQAAPECLKTERKDKTIVLTNTCREPITVPYCSLTRPIWGKTCGSGSKVNPYYTHLTNLKPDEKSDTNGFTDVKFAPCRGSFYSYDPKGFLSDTSGAYTCPIAKVDPRGKPNAQAAASAKTSERACELARELFPAADRATSPCECKSIRNGLLHYCSAAGWAKNATSPVNGMKDWLREVENCDPTKDERRCESKKLVSMGGVRG